MTSDPRDKAIMVLLVKTGIKKREFVIIEARARYIVRAVFLANSRDARVVDGARNYDEKLL